MLNAVQRDRCEVSGMERMADLTESERAIRRLHSGCAEIKSEDT